jgi:hypothetical protein
MHTAEELLKRAAECERMATATRDPGSKTTWKGMADRWRQCAETATSDSLAAVRHSSQPHSASPTCPSVGRPSSVDLVAASVAGLVI